MPRYVYGNDAEAILDTALLPDGLVDDVELDIDERGTIVLKS